MVAEKRFRDDLYYRLAVVEVTLPRLANRKEDLPLLQRHFLERFAAQYSKEISGITRRGQALLARYHWPGNVRELENVIGSACMLAQGRLSISVIFPSTFVLEPSLTLMTTWSAWKQLNTGMFCGCWRQPMATNRAAEILGISRGLFITSSQKLGLNKSLQRL
jgi:DNA-binding NtrC family response regulator